MSSAHSSYSVNDAPDPSGGPDDTLDFPGLLRRLRRGLPQILSFGLIGIVVAAAAFLIVSPALPVTTSTRVVFAFGGIEHNQYPDGSIFRPEDVISPQLVVAALRKIGMDADGERVAKLREGLTIEPLVAPEVAKARDRARAVGDPIPAFVPDEYQITLSMRRIYPMTSGQRSAFIGALVSEYRAWFARAFGQIPEDFGNIHNLLKEADLTEYQKVWTSDLQNLTSFLTKQQTVSQGYRSPNTHMSFGDLRRETELFSSIRVASVLGVIYGNNLSRDPARALQKVKYRLGDVDLREKLAKAEDVDIEDLLAKAEMHSQSYALAVRASASDPHPSAAVVDRPLVDSLIAGDAYNKLVDRAIFSRQTVAELESERSDLMNQQGMLERAAAQATANQALLAEVEGKLSNLEQQYDELVTLARQTQSDFATDQFGAAIRADEQTRTTGLLRYLAIASAIGLFLGLFLSCGLSLLGIFVAPKAARTG